MGATSAVPAQRRDFRSGPSAELPGAKCPPALSSKIWQLRFLSICLIAVVHIPAGRPEAVGSGYAWAIVRFLDSCLPYGFARVALPFFFAASGYFYFSKAIGPVTNWYWPQLRKRLKSLLVPYLIWTAGFTLITEWARFLPLASKLVRHSVHCSAAVWIDRIALHPIPMPLWSIRELLLYALASPLIWAAMKFAGKPVLLLLALWWYLDPAPERMILRSRSVFFFSLGAYLALHAFPLHRFSLRKYKWVLLSAWVVLVIGKSALIASFGGQWRPVHVASVMVGLLSFWTLYDDVAPSLRAMFQRLSPYTFFVFLVHINVLYLVGRLWFRAWDPSNPFAYLSFDLLGPWLVVVISISLGLLAKRGWPGAYATATGWRPAPGTLSLAPAASRPDLESV